MISFSKRLYIGATQQKYQRKQPSGTAYMSDLFTDLRSDTVTRPSEKMRDAMAKAIVGDDIYKDCPTTNKLERMVSELLGKEAALLTCSGAQANLIS